MSFVLVGMIDNGDSFTSRGQFGFCPIARIVPD
jgi:hypothetical protein